MKLTALQIRLIELLADGGFYSGQQVALKLGVSRTSVWNHLRIIESVGIDLHAVKGKGTRLAEAIELLNMQQILEGLPASSKKLLKQFELLSQSPSTNQHLVKQSRLQRVQSGAVCAAEMQTAGKGRLGRTWVSPFGQNIYISFLWNFKSGIAALSGLSLACGVAVSKALENIGLKGQQLKWPNDILFDGKKLGGILVEIQGENQHEFTAVVGVGLNCQMSASASKDIDQPWIDLKTAMGETKFSRNVLISELINQMLPLLNTYAEDGLAPYMSNWNEYDGYKNKKIKITSGKNMMLGVAKGITELGELRMLKNTGEEQLVSSGEVSLRLE